MGLNTRERREPDGQLTTFHRRDCEKQSSDIKAPEKTNIDPSGSSKWINLWRKDSLLWNTFFSTV